MPERNSRPRPLFLIASNDGFRRGRRRARIVQLEPASGGDGALAALPEVGGIGHSAAMDRDLSQYRPNVGIVVFNRDGQVWLGRRVGAKGTRVWQFPQGGVDAGEDLEAAAIRELREETGIGSVETLGRTEKWIAYDFPRGYAGTKAARGWRGQRQIWFAMRFTGENAEVDLKHHEEIEFDAWRWADIDEAMGLVAPFKREAYAQVIAAFRPYARALGG